MRLRPDEGEREVEQRRAGKRERKEGATKPTERETGDERRHVELRDESKEGCNSCKKAFLCVRDSIVSHLSSEQKWLLGVAGQEKILRLLRRNENWYLWALILRLCEWHMSCCTCHELHTLHPGRLHTFCSAGWSKSSAHIYFVSACKVYTAVCIQMSPPPSVHLSTLTDGAWCNFESYSFSPSPQIDPIFLRSCPPARCSVRSNESHCALV